MIIRDVCCNRCGTVVLDHWCDSIATTGMDLPCSTCGDVSRHEAVCNGGTRSRWRYCDYPDDPEFYRGQVTAQSLTANDSDGDPVRRYTSGTREVGAPMHDADRYHNGTDSRESRRDEIRHDARRKRGSLPITVDLGKKPNGD